MTPHPLYLEIVRILDNEENMLTHQRREYWASEIILLVRRDEKHRIHKEVVRYYRNDPKEAAAILGIIDNTGEGWDSES
jgi:hypothetical protein